MCVKEHVSNQEISRKGQVLAIGFRYNLAQAEGKVIGAISISGPVFRWHKESMEQHISLLLKTAESISNSLY
ncbi:IclR family transcriptional regulator C-terminal domain-containing protein [Peribacillus frigoritolerans]|nr:IclR family transcriptional regulator C-terminal domain-containing protein [Peribacillus frigoritolerans]